MKDQHRKRFNMKTISIILLVLFVTVISTGCNEQSKEENDPIEYGG